jgi:alpha-N-arabinofuranosidase
MNIKRLVASIIITVIALWPGYLKSQSKQGIVVSVDKPIAAVQPTMWGIFFEDINFGADGGIYAEMVKNRSFEFSMPLMGWAIHQNKFSEGSMLILNRQE